MNGGGTVTLASSSAARITADTLLNLTNTNNLIQGRGQIGVNAITITNQGTINANISGQSLTIDPANSANAFSNESSGTVQASNGGILVLSGNGGGTFTNSGTIKAVAGVGILSDLEFTGTVTSTGTVDVDSNILNVSGNGNFTQTAGTFRMAGGTVTSSTALNFTGGLIDARGTINSAISNGANLQPALGGSGLNVNGTVSLLSSSKLTFQLGGLTQGSQYGFLNVNGTVALGGQLVVSFVNSFQATGQNTFTVLSSTALSGSFLNVPSGSRVSTTDGSGTFLVTYGPNNSVVLSNFEVGGPEDAGSQKIPVARTATVRPLASSDDPRSFRSGSRASRAPASAPRRGIALQNSDQLRDLMDAPGATTTNGRVVIHPRPARNRTLGRSDLPILPSVAEERAIVQRDAAIRPRPTIRLREN